MATTITRYVDGSNGNNGNGGTSWADAWQTLVYAESVVDDYGENGDGDYTATGGTYPDGIIVEIYGRNINDSAGLTVAGITTSATNYLSIKIDKTGSLTNTNADVFSVSVDHVKVDGNKGIVEVTRG